MSLQSLLINAASLLNKIISIFLIHCWLVQEKHINQSNTLELLHPISFLLKTVVLYSSVVYVIHLWFAWVLLHLMYVRFQQGVCYLIHTGFSCMAHSDAFVCVHVYVCVWDQCGRRSLETACRNTRHTHTHFSISGPWDLLRSLILQL